MGKTDMKSTGFRIVAVAMMPLAVFANAYKGAELRTKEAYVYGRFEARYETAVGVRAGVGERQQRGRVRQQSAKVVKRRLTE